ncbi:hypothetical protein Athai_48920 [Actinocatenispora thailandica]|uniref:Intracellular septation protein A n=2 Tax=Actinocatenispora thailandica TaxID=227318 RepID=A0A7R7DT85_9ACTN|nr:VC0807 family protein [Actinocatenispora thailandica]BCJ37389.1 hypothetical protein Athai_48920 [Actinocatenispora thailandica]
MRWLGPVADLALPVGGYYLLRWLGLSDWTALLAGTLAAGLRVLVVAVLARRVTWFGALTLAVFGVGLALAFVGGDARFLLWKDSAATGAVGMVFLASVAAGRPLTLSAAQTWRPGRAGALAAAYRAEPSVRRALRGSAIGWGAGLVADAALRLAVAYLLPLDVAVGLTAALPVVTLVAIGGWNVGYLARAGRRSPRLASFLPGLRAAAPARRITEVAVLDPDQKGRQ